MWLIELQLLFLLNCLIIIQLRGWVAGQPLIIIHIININMYTYTLFGQAAQRLADAAINHYSHPSLPGKRG